MRTSYPRLHGVANLVLRDRDRAQDAVQDALVLAWRNIRALRDGWFVMDIESGVMTPLDVPTDATVSWQRVALP